MTPPAGVSVSYVPRGFTLTWAAVPGASSYEVLLDPDGAGPAPAAPAGVTDATTLTLTDIPLHASLNATFKVRACSGSVCGSASAIVTPDLTQAIGYVKASNTRAGAYFGTAVALSGDGNTLAIGSWAESGGVGGVNGDQSDTSALWAGAVYVYGRSAGTWAQQAYVKAARARPNSTFGSSVSLSHDGSMLAVGAPGEASDATGINGDDLSTAAPSSGAAYVFVRSAGSWSQQAYMKASNTQADDRFGASVALSGDGSTLLVGAPWEDAAGGDQTNNAAPFAGAVYAFVRSGATWSQQAYIKPLVTSAGLFFGSKVALSGDGNLLAVGAPGDSSNATGVNGSAVDTSAPAAGAAYVFLRTGTTWTQQAYLKASNTRTDALFGSAVAVSADGSTVAVGSTGESSNAVGLYGNESNTSAPSAGAAYVFRRSGSAWAQEVYAKASNTAALTEFGVAVALSGDGQRLVIGSHLESSNAKGVGGDATDQSLPGAGAAYAFVRRAGVWSQQAYLKPSNTGTWWGFGYGLAMTADGQLIAVGALQEASNARGIGGDQADTSMSDSGAVYLF